MPEIDILVVERFWAKVDKDGPVPTHLPSLGPCWVWTRATTEWGYGVLRFSGRRWRAHRVAWEMANGDIPQGQLVLHRCDNPRCVKNVADESGPAHLFLGTNDDNMADMVAKGRGAGAVGERNGTHTKPERRARGNRHPNTKLTPAIVLGIRDRVARGETRTSVAKDLGVSVNTVSLIVMGKSWAWLNPASEAVRG